MWHFANNTPIKLNYETTGGQYLYQRYRLFTLDSLTSLPLCFQIAVRLFASEGHNSNYVAMSNKGKGVGFERKIIENRAGKCGGKRRNATRDHDVIARAR